MSVSFMSIGPIQPLEYGRPGADKLLYVFACKAFTAGVTVERRQSGKVEENLTVRNTAKRTRTREASLASSH
jgi:hypothetical protein